MFGYELAYGASSLGGKMFYKIFGIDHIGTRIRAFHITKIMYSMAKRGTWLDAGSGSGSYAFYFSRRFRDCDIRAIEMNDLTILNSLKILKHINRKNLNFTLCDLRNLNIKDSFECIYCVDVLEHIEEDELVLRNF